MENLTIENQEPTIAVDSQSSPTVDQIQGWLTSYLSQLLDIEIEEISTSTSFARYGLDSSASILLANDLGDWLGTEIDPTIVYSYPTIDALTEYIAG